MLQFVIRDDSESISYQHGVLGDKVLPVCLAADVHHKSPRCEKKKVLISHNFVEYSNWRPCFREEQREVIIIIVTIVFKTRIQLL